MDIAIQPKILRIRHWLAMGRWLLSALMLAGLVLLLRYWLSPALDLGELRVAVVEQGSVSTEVQATGTVVPINERVLVSPLTSSITDVYVALGSHVNQGEALLKIDSRQIEQDIARVRDELHLKDLQMQGLQQQQEQKLRELHNQQELLGIDLQQKQVMQSRYKTLFEDQIVPEFQYEEVRIDVTKTELQLKQLAQQITDIQASDANLREQNSVEKQLLWQNLQKLEQQLDETTIRAGADGIVTVLMSELGQNVSIGAELARISNLSAFRVDATLSDYYLHQIAECMPVRIDFGVGVFAGRLSRILPAVDNGTIRLQIELDDPANTQLKQNLRVEAAIVTDAAASTLRVANGIVFNGTGIQDIFVLEDGKAVKRQVEVGMSNSRHVEIRSGLAVGERIIISDMSDYDHLQEIAIRD